MEMNLSETAFVERTETRRSLWSALVYANFEIDLCGHATLASSFLMFESGLGFGNQTIRFSTLSGGITSKKRSGFSYHAFSPLIQPILRTFIFF